jgi:general secretion pathway protein J
MKHGTNALRRGRPRGFTLIEMLVALTLLAVIALLSWRGLDSTIRGRDDIVASLSKTRLLGRYFSQLQYDTLNMVTPDEVFGAPLRILPGELVLVRHLDVGGAPSRLQVVRYQLKDHTLIRSASTPLSNLSQLTQALHHMDDFASVVASDDVRSIGLSVWVSPDGWTSNQSVVELAYSKFIAQHGVSTISARGMPLPRGVRFTISMGTPPVDFVRTFPISQ